jgi:hypothetical protein
MFFPGIRQEENAKGKQCHSRIFLNVGAIKLENMETRGTERYFKIPLGYLAP